MSACSHTKLRIVTTSGIFKWIIPDYSAMTSHIAQFPTLCWFWLSGPFGASDSEAETLNSGNFTMLSTSGPANTWAASTTFASSFPTTASSTMAASTTTPGASGSGVSGSAAATSPIHTPSPLPTPVNGGGLSQGAKAAIGVGVAAIFVLALAFVYIFLLRRRLSGLQRQLHSRQMNQNTPTQRFDRPEGMHNINPMYSLRMEANDPEVIHENPARGIYEKDNDTLRRQY